MTHVKPAILRIWLEAHGRRHQSMWSALVGMFALMRVECRRGTPAKRAREEELRISRV